VHAANGGWADEVFPVPRKEYIDARKGGVSEMLGVGPFYSECGAVASPETPYLTSRRHFDNCDLEIQLKRSTGWEAALDRRNLLPQ